jgi:hypothetical protein
MASEDAPETGSHDDLIDVMLRSQEITDPDQVEWLTLEQGQALWAEQERENDLRRQIERERNERLRLEREISNIEAELRNAEVSRANAHIEAEVVRAFAALGRPAGNAQLYLAWLRVTPNEQVTAESIARFVAGYLA